MATAKPSDARSECGQYSYSTLKSREYIHSKSAGSCLCQIFSNLERVWSNRGWRWCCRFDNGEWKKISASTTAHNRKTLFDLDMPYLRLSALSAVLREVADALHPPLPAILNVVEKRH